MANIPIGTAGEEKLLVSSEVAINFLATEGARVLTFEQRLVVPQICDFREMDDGGAMAELDGIR